MDNKIISPCISICKTDPVTGYCYGCARTDEEKKFWKDEKTDNNWKSKNLAGSEVLLGFFQDRCPVENRGVGAHQRPIYTSFYSCVGMYIQMKLMILLNLQ